MPSTSFDDLVEPKWLNDGARVWVNIPMTPEDRGTHPNSTRWLACVAVCVAGNHARVVNLGRGIDRWESLNDGLFHYGLRVLKSSPYAEHGEVIARRSLMRVAKESP